MKTLITSFTSIVIAAILALLTVPNANSMGLRSLVALPLDKYGYVIRFYMCMRQIATAIILLAVLPTA